MASSHEEQPLDEKVECEICKKSFLHTSNLNFHLQLASGCRIKRAVLGIKRRREQGLPDPEGPVVERRPIAAEVPAFVRDPIDFAPLDDDYDPSDDDDQAPASPPRPNVDSESDDEPAQPVKEKPWDSTEQFVAWIKRAKLSQSQTDEAIRLFRDERMSLREALETIRSHRDVDRYLMQQVIGEDAKMVDLQRAGGLDPGPVLLTYKPLLPVVKKMAAKAEAVLKRNGRKGKFVLKPVIQYVKEMERQADGTMKEVDSSVREYDHPSTGTWWNKYQEEIDADPDFQGENIVVLPIIIYLDKTTMDGLRRVSVFPMYVSLANYSWDFYNERGGLELVALLPQPKPDPDWPHPGYKPKTDDHRNLRRHFITSGLAIVTESARKASWEAFDFVDPKGVRRKGVTAIYCISKDLGEASTISNCRSKNCDSCLVSPKELNRIDRALDGAYPPRLEPQMRVAIRGLLDHKNDRSVRRADVVEESQRIGAHPQMPWFFDWKFGDRDWNSPYLKMVPDDLHTVYGGVLGSHLLNIMDNIGAIHPDRKKKFLSFMDVRIHQIYLKHNPDLRLPASKTFFSERIPVPCYEWKAVMQVLPILVAGLFHCGGRDILLEWAVAFVDWVHATFWTEKGIHNDNTLKESDRLLRIFDDKCTNIANLQPSQWNFRKYHDLAKFTSTVERLGATRWTSTERGEHEHHWVKIWWASMNGKNVDEALYQAWLRAIAIETLESQRAQIAECVRQRGTYESAMVKAMDSTENRLPLTNKFTILWQNLLLAESPDRMIVDGHTQRKHLLELQRAQPLLSLLPAALGTYFAEAVGNMTGAALRRLDPIKYLRETTFDPRLHIVTSCYIVPHDDGRERLQAARATPKFHGRPIFSDLGLAGENDNGEGEMWYGRAIVFFKAYHRVQEWSEAELRLVWNRTEHQLVFLRWFKVTGIRDGTRCTILQWQAGPRGRPQEPAVQVVAVEALTSVQMTIPKASQTRGLDLWYVNKYYR